MYIPVFMFKFFVLVTTKHMHSYFKNFLGGGGTLLVHSPGGDLLGGVSRMMTFKRWQLMHKRIHAIKLQSTGAQNGLKANLYQ